MYTNEKLNPINLQKVIEQSLNFNEKHSDFLPDFLLKTTDFHNLSLVTMTSVHTLMKTCKKLAMVWRLSSHPQVSGYVANENVLLILARCYCSPVKTPSINSHSDARDVLLAGMTKAS